MMHLPPDLKAIVLSKLGCRDLVSTCYSSTDMLDICKERIDTLWSLLKLNMTDTNKTIENLSVAYGSR